MALSLRSYEPHDFAALHKLDQSCFPPGISYSKTTLRYFLTIPSADCVVAVEESHIAGLSCRKKIRRWRTSSRWTWRRKGDGAVWAPRFCKNWNPTSRRAECVRFYWRQQQTMKLRLPSGSATAIVAKRC